MRSLPHRALPALSLILALAPAEAIRAEAAPGPVLEVAEFRLVPGTSEADFLLAAQATMPPLRDHPGFLSRRITRSETGVWSDLVLWTDLTSAKAAAAAMMADPAFAAFVARIDMATLTMRHDRVMWQAD